MFFENRADAGLRLARVFLDLNRDFSGWEVVGIARGGVIVAAQIAEALKLPLQALYVDDFFVAEGKLVVTSLDTACLFPRKGTAGAKTTFFPEISTIGIGGISEFAEEVLAKGRRYNNGQACSLGKRIILCDDGLVSGHSALAVIRTLKHNVVEEIILAIPVVPPWLMEKGSGFEIVTWRVTTLRNAKTGMFYYNFEEVPDEEVVRAVQTARERVY